MSDFKAFQTALRERNVAHLSLEVPADLLTPASVFLRLGGDRARHAFLLESVEGGENVGRFSIIGIDPAETLTLTSDSCLHQHGGRTTRLDPSGFARVLRSRLYGRLIAVPDNSIGLTGGWVGYLGYDCVRLFERLPSSHSNSSGRPWAVLGNYTRVVVFDHVRQTARAVATIGKSGSDDPSPKRAYDEAQRDLAAIIRKLSRPSPLPGLGADRVREAKSITTRSQFTDGVRAFKKHIGRGDIFQGVLSQRFDVKGRVNSFEVYRRLRRSNPSPYMYYLRCDGFAIAGSSPETLVQKRGAAVTTRPIAGTRPRGASPADDARMERNLLMSVKENAEHIMLVDLGRNDLGRVCVSGTVATTQFRAIDKYSHVMHIVSTVTGKARRRVDSFDVIAATFPAGTVTGAPKIRAMELIDQYEPHGRGVYAGCVGYIDWYDNLDMAIAIRTAVIDRDGGSVQAGAGIVADSDPDREYEETCNKAAAPLHALGGVIKKT